jgi:hypothetical protein
MSESLGSKFWLGFERIGRAILLLGGIAIVASTIILIVVQHVEKSELASEPGPVSSPASRTVAANPKPSAPTVPPAGNIMSQATTLEVPGASLGFGGNWGGYSSGTIYTPSGVPVDSIATAPEAITFQVRDGTVVLRFTIVGDPNNNIVGASKAWAPSTYEVAARLELATFEYRRVEISRYKLVGYDRISYSTDVDVYNAHSGELVATIKRKATFEKLEGEAEKRWEKAQAEWEAQHHAVDLGTFESPAEKAANE